MLLLLLCGVTTQETETDLEQEKTKEKNIAWVTAETPGFKVQNKEIYWRQMKQVIFEGV